MAASMLMAMVMGVATWMLMTVKTTLFHEPH
jgi:hypothetical protein